MFGLVKIQEMIPGNKHILLKTSFSCEIQQVIWVIWLKREKTGIGRWWPSWILIFRLIKIQKWCQKWALYATFSRKSDSRRVSMTIHLKVTFSIWPQAAILNFGGWTGQNTKKDARSGFSMPQLVGKVVLHSFRYQFGFKLHFQYGHRRPFWILASHKFRRHFREGHGGNFVSKYFKELKSSVKPYYTLSGHGTPRLHPTKCSCILMMKFLWAILKKLGDHAK